MNPALPGFFCLPFLQTTQRRVLAFEQPVAASPAFQQPLIAGDFEPGLQYKTALVRARVRQGQLRRVHFLVTKGEQVEIECAGFVDHTTAGSAEAQFDCLQLVQQGQRIFISTRLAIG